MKQLFLLSYLHTIGGKFRLAIMVTVAFALVSGFGAVLVVETRSIRESQIFTYQSLAHLMAARSVFAVVFNDTEAATENLRALSTYPAISDVSIFLNDGKYFAYHDTPSAATLTPLLAPTHAEAPPAVSDDFMVVTAPVVRDGELLGSLVLRANRNNYHHQLNQLLMLAASVLLASLLAAWAVAGWLQRLVTRPIEALAQATRRTAGSQPDYSQIVEKQSNDEIGQLTDAFNTMLSTIRRRDQDLIEVNEQLENRVTQRTEALNASNQQLQHLADDLRVAKEAADQANLAKSNFLAHMSHELRTPLNAILGFSQLLAKDHSAPPRQREQLGIINRSGEHLLTMINDVLDLSRIEAGKINLNAVAFDLHRLCGDITDMMRLRADEKGLGLSLSIADDLPRTIRTDAGKLRQIIINFVGNAIKYSERGHISLRLLLAEPNRIRLEVEDTGVGIPEDMLSDIFDPFVQVGTHRQSKGSGLGLAISHRYAEMMGGQMGLTSVINQGSCFWANVPIEVVAEDEVLADLPDSTEVIGLAADQPTWRILVAEDEPNSQMLIQSILGQVGFQVRIANNGEEAVHLFNEWSPHLILMDIRMPVMDGLTASRTIRLQSKGHTVPILALTASVFQEECGAIIEAGCQDMLTKPINVPLLFKTLAEYLPIQYRLADTADTRATEAADAQPDQALPTALSAALLAAAERLDGDAIEALLPDLTTLAPTLAASLSQALKAFDFEQLSRLLEAAQYLTHKGEAKAE